MKTKYLFLCPVLFQILAACAHSPAKQDSVLQSFTLQDPPSIGISTAGQNFLLGGASSLIYLGETNNEKEFLTTTDRGPNADAIKYITGVGKDVRPFLVPNFQPRWYKLRLTADGKMKATEQVLLSLPNGKPISGRSNRPTTKNKTSDEQPSDANGNAIAWDPMGLDLEGMTKDDQGHIWMCDEYRPAIIEFDSNGKMIRRIIPAGTKIAADKWTEDTLPAIYGKRQLNRGFEGIAYQNGKLYAVLQSPIKYTDAKNKRVVRILEFDIKSNKPTGEYLYLLEDEKVDKMGDLISFASGQFLLLEQNSQTGPQSLHKVFKIDISNATNTLAQTLSAEEPFELQTLEILLSTNKLVEKTLFVDLVAKGYDFAEKVEGISLVGSNEIAVINDDDFRISGELDIATGLVKTNPSRQTVLGLITIK